MTFLEIALAHAARGWYVFPCIPRTKRPLIKDNLKQASKDESQIRTWWAKTPDANIGIACGLSNLAVMDIDHGLPDDTAAILWLGSNGIPATYMVRTGRRPEFGLQIYFENAIPDVGLWQLNGCEGQIKSLGGYVMAAGSIHPDTGLAYTIKNDAPLCRLPDVVRGLKTFQLPVKTSGPMEKIPEGAGRHHGLTQVAGKLRNSGLDYDALLGALIPLNDSMCEVPVSLEDLEHIARSMCRYAVPEPEPIAVISNEPTPATDATINDADMPDALPRPRYPDDVWADTAYGEFAELCADGNYIPKKFFIESLRTVTGSIVGDKLTCPITGVNPRAFTIKIAGPGAGKGTSEERVRDLFSERWEGTTRTENALLFGPKDYAWRSRGIGACIINPASAPGLMKSIEPRKIGKGEMPNALEVWQPVPRIISIQEEVRGMFANFANESTGAGLESILCELFDRTTFSSTATKDRPAASSRMMYGLLGGITKEGWDSVFSRVESVESGFMSRLNIIATEESRTVATLREPNFESLRRRFFPLIQNLADNPRHIEPSPGATQLVEKWFAGITLPEGVSRARLNIHAWRCALHLAWLRGHEFITEADADAGIRLAKYQAQMREWYAPPEGETRAARCQAAIRKVMRGAVRMSLRDLRDKTNYRRVGVGDWQKALDLLVKSGEIRIADDERPGGKVRKIAILLKTKD